MGRQVYLLGVGVALVAGVFVATEAALGPRPGVTEANMRKIKPGMTLSEVEVLLGGPGRRGWTFGRLGGFVSKFVWSGVDGQAEVTFYEPVNLVWPAPPSPPPSVLCNATFQRTAPPGPLACLRAWLGW